MLFKGFGEHTPVYDPHDVLLDVWFGDVSRFLMAGRTFRYRGRRGARE